MATQKALTVKGLNKVLRSLPKIASGHLRDASQDIAEEVAGEARGRAGSSRGWKYVAPTIKASRDRVPVVRLGSTRRIPGRSGSRQTVGDMAFGTEFGGRGRPTTQQFLPHLGRTGYALWPTVRAMSDDIDRKYSAALDRALQDL